MVEDVKIIIIVEGVDVVECVKFAQLIRVIADVKDIG